MAFRIVATNAARDQAAKGQVGTVTFSASYFKFGEGGWDPESVTNEVIAVAPGGTANFTGTLSNIPTIPGSITIDESVTAQTLTDDGNGSFTGDGTGTINYNTGEYDITFTTVIGVGDTVYGDYQYRKTPKEPDPSRTDLEADNDSTLAIFQKSFGVDSSTKLEFVGDGLGTCRCYCFMALSEGNDNGRASPHGPIPYWSEIGIFDGNDVLMAYGTFDLEEKTGAGTILKKVDLIN